MVAGWAVYAVCTGWFTLWGVRVSTLNNRKVLSFPVIRASLLKDRSDCHRGVRTALY